MQNYFLLFSEYHHLREMCKVFLEKNLLLRIKMADFTVPSLTSSRTQFPYTSEHSSNNSAGEMEFRCSDGKNGELDSVWWRYTKYLKDSMMFSMWLCQLTEYITLCTIQ